MTKLNFAIRIADEKLEVDEESAKELQNRMTKRKFQLLEQILEGTIPLSGPPQSGDQNRAVKSDADRILIFHFLRGLTEIRGDANGNVKEAVFAPFDFSCLPISSNFF